MPNMGVCRLCEGVAEDLQLSHIIPAFAFRWLRESSGNGFLRSSDQPNLRVQDGPQEYWLCEECEGRLNRSETAFGNRFFFPYLNGRSGGKFQYERWLLEFCTSLSWRALEYQLSNIDDSDQFSRADMARIESARNRWKAFLLGNAPHPGEFRQHLLPLDEVNATSVSNLPANINRYLMRAIDIDLCHTESGGTIFVFSKIARFAIIGFINGPPSGQWQGTKVNANRGTIEPRDYAVPKALLDYLCHKARCVTTAHEKISERQREKIDKAFLSNVDQLRGSDFFKAMEADVKMFGRKAFTGPSTNFESRPTDSPEPGLDSSEQL